MRKWKMLKASQDNLFDDAVLFCVCRGPDETHPYIETAEFKIPFELFKTLDPATTGHAEIFDLARAGLIECTGAGTWGDYWADGSNMGCKNHFIYEEGIPFAGWFQSGLEHRLPPGLYDERMIRGVEMMEGLSLLNIRARWKADGVPREEYGAVKREYGRVLKLRSAAS